MCGIAGKVTNGGDPAAARVVVEAMCGALAHRGPDGAGVEIVDEAVLGHRRLAIIDLSDAAAQPMRSADGRAVVVFNGEIYNFGELRRDLEGLGHTFRTRSDTEVLLAAYRQWGRDCLSRLRGMFAFAIWDRDARRLFAARDRLGKKPFLYAATDGGLTFGSELRALVADPAVARTPDPDAINDFLSYGYVPAPRTGFAGVSKLPPAHWLEYQEGRVTTGCYWTLSYEPKHDLSDDEAAEGVLARLREAVALRLISDVPLGAFLSGGVDSSVVVALMAEHGAVRTFSIGFEEKEYDERQYARAVARHCATEHEEFVVRPAVEDLLPSLVRHYGEPYADSSAIPTWYLAQMTRRHVTVALNGDGGDESFGGYERYLAAVVAGRTERVPRWVRRAGSRAVKLVNRRPRKDALLHRLDRFFEALDETPPRRYGRWVGYFSNPQKAALLTPAFAERLVRPDSMQALDDAYAAGDARALLDKTMHADVLTYLPGDLLPKVDIASMAHSLEARSPLLDHEVVEFCARLPVSMKVRGRTTKYLLKKIARTLVPAEVVDRPKRGFGVPVDHWLRAELRELADDCLFSPRASGRGYFEPALVRQVWQRHQDGTGRYQHLLWNLLMLELWHREFIDRPSRSTATFAGANA